jgi:hypothetical protein
MKKEIQTCVVDATGVGKICVDKDQFTFSLTDDAKKTISGVLEKQLPFLPEEKRHLAEKQLSKLRVDGGTDSSIPLQDISMIGAFNNPDKGPGILAMSLKDDAAKKHGLPQNFAAVHLGKRELSILSKATPDSVKRASSMKEFAAAVKKK